jgi:hypothetical protein
MPSKFRFTHKEAARMRELERDGYLFKIEHGDYAITMEGLAVLLAEADAPIPKPTKKPERGQ